MGLDAGHVRRRQENDRARKRIGAFALLAATATGVASAWTFSRGASPPLRAIAARAHGAPPATWPSRSPASAPSGFPGAPIAADSLARVRSEAMAAVAEVSAPSRAPKASSPETFDAAMRLFRNGRFDEALVEFQSVTPPTAEAAMWAARSLRASGDFAGAALLFAEVAAGYSGSSAGDDAILEAGRCYRALGHLDKAREWLRPLRATATHAAKAQEELDGMERDVALARKRAKQAAEAPRDTQPILAPRGIDPSPNASPPRRPGFPSDG